MKSVGLTLLRSIILSVAVFLSACTTSKVQQGEDFSVQKALYVVHGMTDTDVLALMDQPPYDRLDHGQSRETWIWVYSYDGETKTFSVLFNDNKVTDTKIIVE